MQISGAGVRRDVWSKYFMGMRFPSGAMQVFWKWLVVVVA